jgi:hypothetical protein
MRLGRVLRWGGSAFVGAGLVGIALTFALLFNGIAVVWPTDAEEILAEAKQKTGQRPPYPPKPAGKTVQEKVTEFKNIRTCANQKIGPFDLGLGQICVERQIPNEVTRERFVDVDSSDIVKWQKEVEQIDATYNARLNANLKEVERKFADERRQELKDWAQILSPVASTVLGIGMLWLGIRKDRREAPETTLSGLPRVEET